jgi:hypothetical protein
MGAIVEMGSVSNAGVGNPGLPECKFAAVPSGLVGFLPDFPPLSWRAESIRPSGTGF